MNNDESTFYINGAEFFYNPATSIYCMDRLNETQEKIISYDLLIPYLQVIKEEAKKHWSAYFSVEIAVKDWTCPRMEDKKLSHMTTKYLNGDFVVKRRMTTLPIVIHLDIPK